MDQDDCQKRIKLQIQIPSLALKHFIEKMLRDDDFFEIAIENPLAALKESGVKLNASDVKPSELAAFFGALAGVKDLISKKKTEEITFENIFGQAAEILGTTIVAETQKGMFTNFNRNAFTDREMSTAVNYNFQTLGEASSSVYSHISSEGQSVTQDRRVYFTTQTKAEFDLVGITTQYKETDRSTTFHFDHKQGVGSYYESSIDTYKSKGFSGVSTIEQIFDGPLISPSDLVKIAAQFNAYLDIVGDMEEF